MPQQRLSSYETGRIEPPTEFLALVAQRFSVDLNWLITGQANPEAVKETGQKYFIRPNLAGMVKDLQKADVVTLSLVREILKPEMDFNTEAEAVAKALGITKYRAMLQILEARAKAKEHK